MLFLSAGQLRSAEAYLLLLAKYLRLEEFHGLRVSRLAPAQTAALSIETLPVLVQPDGRTLYSLASITEALLQPLNLDLLLGIDEQERTDHFRFFELCGVRGPAPAELAEEINKDLSGHFFLEKSTTLHVSDLCVFTALSHFMFALSAQEKTRLHCLYRWFWHLQEMEGVRENLAACGLPVMDRLGMAEGGF